MGAKYEKEKKEMDKGCQDMLKSAQKERDEAEKRGVAAVLQAQTDRDSQNRQYEGPMNQMKMEHISVDRDEVEKRRVETVTLVQNNLAR